MKKLKNVLCIILMLALVFTNSTISFASSSQSVTPDELTNDQATQYAENYFGSKGQDNILQYLRGIMSDKNIAEQLKNKSMYSTRMNEVEKLKKLQNTQDSKLKEMGYSSEEIKNIKQIDCNKIVNEYKKCSDKELIAKGFSTKRIDAIRNFDGSEQALSAMGANCDVIVWYDTDYCYYSRSNNRTYAKVQYNWFWDKVALLYVDIDMMAFAWSEGMYLTSPNNATCNVGYMSSMPTYLAHTYQPTVKVHSPVGSCYFEFPYKTPWPETDGTYALNGSGHLIISKDGKVGELGMVAKYGHTEMIIIPPGVTFGTPPSLTIQFAKSMYECDNVYIYLSAFEQRP